MSLSTHVLDTGRGIPAAGVSVTVEHRTGDGAWTTAASGATDDDGRIGDLLASSAMRAGDLRLTFGVADYYAALDTPTFWADVTIAVVVTDPESHHHVPLLLSPFGYSTYRGS